MSKVALINPGRNQEFAINEPLNLGFIAAFLEKNNISVPMKNIHEDTGAKEELIRIGGKGQVPCLVIDGKALYESDDIIEWFKNQR